MQRGTVGPDELEQSLGAGGHLRVRRVEDFVPAGHEAEETCLRLSGFRVWVRSPFFLREETLWLTTDLLKSMTCAERNHGGVY